MGAFDRGENRDALKYCIQEILPLVRRENPTFKFYVAGSGCERVRRLTRGFDDIVVAGFVENLPLFLSKMEIALLPLRRGAGVKVKMLECMAAGLSVVTTAVGAEGIGGKHGLHYLLGDTPKELACHTVRLLKDQGLAEALGDKARELLVKECDFEGALENMWSIVQSRLAPANAVKH